MTYTGRVTPGGAADIRELTSLRIAKLAVDETMANNCYLLTCRATGENLLIDAADDAPALIALCEGELATLVTTHQHWDHHRAAADVVASTGAKALVGAPDADAFTEQTGVAVARALDDGDRIRVGHVVLDVIALAGHTPGSIALLYQPSDGTPHLWTGDSLFPGGVGKTWSPEDFRVLIDEVDTKVFDRLPDETWFYPGHGNDSTLGAERPHLGEWRKRGW